MRTRLFVAALAGLFVLGFGQSAFAQFCNPSTSSTACLGHNCSQLGSTIMDVDHKNIVACLADGASSDCPATAGNCVWRAMAPVPPTCASGYTLQYSNASSSFVCVGISTINSCPAGQVMTGMTNGAPQCANTVTIPGCPSGQMMTGINDGQPVCGGTTIQCPTGQVLSSDVNGTVTCVANDGTYTCPSGQVLTGISNGVAQCATANGNVSCPAGQVMTGISNGQAVCVVQTSDILGGWGTYHAIGGKGNTPNCRALRGTAECLKGACDAVGNCNYSGYSGIARPGCSSGDFILYPGLDGFFVCAAS
ncbi:MAG: hypothetical protein P4M13_02120 [Alphaproteobacteria bacterium]|nr:hypothetical protein [Alphaproteobacteria bacterium]